MYRSGSAALFPTLPAYQRRRRRRLTAACAEAGATLHCPSCGCGANGSFLHFFYATAGQAPGWLVLATLFIPELRAVLCGWLCHLATMLRHGER